MTGAPTRVRALVSAVGHAAREIALWGRFVIDRARGRRRTMVFLQSDHLSGRLRAVAVAHALRRRGWAAIVVPPQLSSRQRQRVLRWAKPEVTVLQQCRHPLNDPAVLQMRGTTVFDLDDADWLDDALRPKLERVASSVDLVIAGSRFVARWARHHNPNVAIVWTTSPLPRDAGTHLPSTPPVVAWASSGADGAPHETAFVRDVLERVARRHRFELHVYGVVDEPLVRRRLSSVSEAGVTIRCHASMPYRRFVDRLRRCDIGLNPLCHDDNPYSEGKSFGKVLAYIAAGVVVVTTATVDHPLFFRNGENGMMADSVDEWVDAIGGLLADPVAMQRVASQALADYRRHFEPDVAAGLLEEAVRATERPAPTDA